MLARLIASHEDQEGDVVDLRDLIDKPAAADFADSRYLLVAVSAKTPPTSSVPPRKATSIAPVR